MEYWKRNLYVVWICQFLAMLGMNAIVPFLPLYLKDLGVKTSEEAALWSGYVFAGPFFLSFFFTPFWGSLGDKYGRRIMTLRAIFGLAIAQFLAGLAQSPVQLLAVRLLQGSLSGFLPAAMALIASNTPSDKTGFALGSLQSSTAAGTVLGPFFGGLIADLFGYRTVFIFVSILLFATGILIIILIEERNKVQNTNEKHAWLSNWLYIFKSKDLLLLSCLLMLNALGISLIRPIFALYVETFNIETKYFSTVAGSLYGIIGVFTTISAFLWGKKSDSQGYRNILMFCSFTVALMYLTHYFIYNLYLLIPVRAILGFAYGALSPLIFALISKKSTFERKGGALGAATSFQILGNMTAPIATGILSSLYGFRIPFIATALLFGTIAFIVYLKIKE